MLLFCSVHTCNTSYCHHFTVTMYRYFSTINSHCLKLVSDSSGNDKHNEESGHLAADICCCSVWLWQWTLQEEHFEKNNESKSLGVRMCILITHTHIQTCTHTGSAYRWDFIGKWSSVVAVMGTSNSLCRRNLLLWLLSKGACKLSQFWDEFAVC